MHTLMLHGGISLHVFLTLECYGDIFLFFLFFIFGFAE